MAVKFSSKQEIISKLRNQIEVKDSTAIHALTFIYGKQVEDEQRHEVVKYHNGLQNGISKKDS